MLNPLTHRKILRKGIPGQARIHAMSTPARGAAKYNLAMTLHVFVEGEAPYEVADQWIVSSKTALGHGMVLPVRVHPGDPQKVAIDWDAHAVAQEQMDADRRSALADMGPVDSLGADAQVIDVRGDPDLRAQILGALGLDAERPGVGDDDDTLSRLERLAALRESGALSEEEFEAQKRMLLEG